MHEKVKGQESLKESFLQILTERFPNIHTFNEEAVNTVYNILVRKLCNTRIREVVSTVRQQMASKKGLASTTDVNLRPILLANHTKLETKFNSHSNIK